jgi:two-component system nitrogen regulation sensor histidine kinase NtrY
MRSKNDIRLVFLGSLIFLVAGMISGSLSYRGERSAILCREFEQVLHRKEKILEDEFAGLAPQLRDQPSGRVFDSRSAEYQSLAVSDGLSVFYYEDDILVYWSDHSIPVDQEWNSRLNKPFISMRNADYVTVIRPLEKGRLLGLVEIRTHYPFENKFLVNGFQRSFGLDPDVNVEFLEEEGTVPVFSRTGTYLFSLDFPDPDPEDRDLGNAARICFLLSVILLFTGLCLSTERSAGRRRGILAGLLIVLIPATAFIFLQYVSGILFPGTELLKPELYASRMFPSLGHLMVISLSVLGMVATFYRYVPFGAGNRRNSPGNPAFWAGPVLFVTAAILLLVVEELIRSLVMDSGISFEASRVDTFSGYTMAGLGVIIAWFISIGLILDRAVLIMRKNRGRLFLTALVSVSVVFVVARFFPGHYSTWTGWVTMLLLLAGHLYLRSKNRERVRFSRFIFLLFFISIFMVIRLQQYSGLKVSQQREVEMIKLSSEHDPVAEMLFSEMSMAIRNDSILGTYMDRPYGDIISQVGDHLRRNYFYGYWSKYDLRVTLCQPGDSLFLEPPDDEWLPSCYAFFDEMIATQGIAIAGSDFYFLENLNGRISYLGTIPYYKTDSEYKVFIELDSKILSEELGYPELLLDERYTAFIPHDFSYARYNHGTLVNRDGEFPYRMSSSFYTSGEKTFETISMDGYEHSIYNVDDENTIIVGSPSVTLVDYLISFSYIFALNFLLLALLYLLSRARPGFSGFNWNFKNRIQYSMAGILFLTFLLICSGTTVFIIRQYQEKTDDNLSNTMRSVYIELIHKVEYEDDLRNWSSDDYYNLDELLSKFSNVFYTDINLYDGNGELLATSRPEIFDRQLLSTRMNRMVYERLSQGRASEFIHDEHIGKLKYISAYVPLLNDDNQFLAYLNLPWFTQSGALARDVTNLVVAVANIYLILLLLILGASVFLADRITQPLRVLQDRIAQVSLSAKNEMIRYDRRDEIKGLVEEYNFMVQELERSASLLAQSERESAWREMAKQIAHEIKNPLTPMRLNVQHLQRTIEEGMGDRERVDRIAATLIEQIDSLSAIAREFSDFAKMPKAQNARVNLVEILGTLLQLFETAEKAEVGLDTGDRKEVYIFADREQLLRVFINLVKNGLQSIPEGRKGVIRIGMKMAGKDDVIVSIRDNGKGIPEEIRDKLFSPNFTTKSGGMGMGLAISGNIVRSMGGKIWYDTVPDEGTTFFVQLPVMVDKSG